MMFHGPSRRGPSRQGGVGSGERGRGAGRGAGRGIGRGGLLGALGGGLRVRDGALGACGLRRALGPGGLLAAARASTISLNIEPEPSKLPLFVVSKRSAPENPLQCVSPSQ